MPSSQSKLGYFQKSQIEYLLEDEEKKCLIEDHNKMNKNSNRNLA